MTQTTPERKPCGTCGSEYTVTANGTIRHHLTENPDFQAGPDSRKCKGAGQPPAGATEETTAGQPQCRLCKAPARLTANGRIGTHLTRENKPRTCPGGSDFPLGTYPDIVGTTDGLVATLLFDCGHREVGACYDCYAARGAESCPDHGDPIECTCRAKAGQAQMAAEKQQTMADQLKALGDVEVHRAAEETQRALDATEGDDVTHLPQASRFAEMLKQETRSVGTVLDVVTNAEDNPSAAITTVVDLHGHRGDPAFADVVYVGRRADKGGWDLQAHPLANPYRIGRDGTASEVVERYKAWLDANPDLVARELPKLRGRRLGCWCGPGQPCHARVLAERADKLPGLSDAEVARIRAAAAAVPDTRTDEQKVRDARMSELTREVIKVLEQRSPEEKAATAARMDRTASAALGLPLDPELNHEYTDPSGTVWVHTGPKETCETPDCVMMRQVDGRPEGFDPDCEQCDTDTHRCPGCGTDVPHGAVACAECTARVAAGDAERQAKCAHPDGFQDTAESYDSDGQDRIVSVCALCGAVDPEDEEDDDSRDPADAWRTSAETVRELMPGDVRGLDAMRLNCAGCGHPVTPLVEAFDLYGKAKAVLWVCEQAQRAGTLTCDSGGHECTPDTRARLGELDEGDHFVRRGTLMRVAERESSTSVLTEVLDGPHRGRTGELKNLNEMVQRAPEPIDPHAREADGQDCRSCGRWTTSAEGLCGNCQRDQVWGYRGPKADTGPVRVGDLEHGDHFIRRGAVMRVTSAGYGLVEAVVVEGPHKGRTGELKNPAEAVERTRCRHEYGYADDGPYGHNGSFCNYCGAGDPATEPHTKEQETKECKDETHAQPRSSGATAPTTTASPTTAPGPGSKPPTKASAPAVSPKSESVTSSAPTAKAVGNGRSAVATTEQDAAARFLGGGRPAAPAANGSADQAQAAAQFLAGAGGSHGEKETKRDRFGRYLIPHPDTGKEQAWTRATTFAKSISDTYALGQWGLRMALLGATMRPDIVQRAHGKHVSADKALLDELTADLKNAAGDKVAANLGTSMHSFKELADKAWHSPGGPRSVMDQVPPDCREDIETYIRLLEELGLEPVPHLVEFTTVVKQYGVAGTSDNCYKVTKPLVLKIGRAEVHLSPGEYVVGDLKTGKDLDYGWQEIAIQIGLYAQGINTSGVWDRNAERWEPDPLSRFDEPGTKVRTDAGIVVHLPVDKSGKKQPAVYGIDLESGWNAAVLCERVRSWRKVRNLSSPVMVSEAEVFTPMRPEPEITTRTTVRPPSLMDKANAVTSKGEASAVWKQAKQDGLSDAEVDELVAVMQDRLAEREEKAG